MLNPIAESVFESWQRVFNDIALIDVHAFLSNIEMKQHEDMVFGIKYSANSAAALELPIHSAKYCLLWVSFFKLIPKYCIID